MKKAIYPGTFDPITKGHLDIIKRASSIFDELVVVVANNANKKASIPAVKRKELIEKCLVGVDNVRVDISNGLTINYAAECKAQAIVRGIRAITDYEYELALATGNMALNSTIETVLMVSKPELSFVSSSIVKEVARYNGDISNFIPKEILEDVRGLLKDE